MQTTSLQFINKHFRSTWGKNWEKPDTQNQLNQETDCDSPLLSSAYCGAPPGVQNLTCQPKSKCLLVGTFQNLHGLHVVLEKIITYFFFLPTHFLSAAWKTKTYSQEFRTGGNFVPATWKNAVSCWHHLSLPPPKLIPCPCVPVCSYAPPTPNMNFQGLTALGTGQRIPGQSYMKGQGKGILRS